MENGGFTKKEKIVLPESFTIKMDADFTSSGATRINKAELVFVGGKLESGEATFYVSDTNGVEKTTECIVKNNQWIDSKTGVLIEEHNSLIFPITKEALEKAIDSGNIKSKEKASGYRDVSYELVK